MFSEQWIIDLAQIMLPVITGFLLMIVLCRALMFWQNKSGRTYRSLWFALFYVFLSILFLGRSANVPPALLVPAYFLFFLVLFPCLYCEWRDFFIYQKNKNATLKDEATPELMTLDKLASDDVHAVLDATPVGPESGGHVALEATPVKPKG